MLLRLRHVRQTMTALAIPREIPARPRHRTPAAAARRETPGTQITLITLRAIETPRLRNQRHRPTKRLSGTSLRIPRAAAPERIQKELEILRRQMGRRHGAPQPTRTQQMQIT